MTTANLFPKEIDGCLDASILKKLCLTTERMVIYDILFFYQLILLLCDPVMLEIENDLRLPYYTEVERFANMSAYESGLGGLYGHKWVPTRARELVNFNGILACDRVLRSSNGVHYHQ